MNRRDGVSGAVPVARSEAAGAAWHALSAGARPNRTPVASDTPTVNSSTRRSSCG